MSLSDSLLAIAERFDVQVAAENLMIRTVPQSDPVGLDDIP